jgi:pimeloyl-ACP methyl ester carboxylesterase
MDRFSRSWLYGSAPCIPHAGHSLPQEEPEAFANAVMELIKA